MEKMYGDKQCTNKFLRLMNNDGSVKHSLKLQHNTFNISNAATALSNGLRLRVVPKDEMGNPIFYDYDLFVESNDKATLVSNNEHTFLINGQPSLKHVLNHDDKIVINDIIIVYAESKVTKKASLLNKPSGKARRQTIAPREKCSMTNFSSTPGTLRHNAQEKSTPVFTKSPTSILKARTLLMVSSANSPAGKRTLSAPNTPLAKRRSSLTVSAPLSARKFVDLPGVPEEDTRKGDFTTPENTATPTPLVNLKSRKSAKKVIYQGGTPKSIITPTSITKSSTRRSIFLDEHTNDSNDPSENIAEFDLRPSTSNASPSSFSNKKEDSYILEQDSDSILMKHFDSIHKNSEIETLACSTKTRRSSTRLSNDAQIAREPNDDSFNVRDVKMPEVTPKLSKLPRNTPADLVGVQRLMRTPRIPNTLVNDLTNVARLTLMSTPVPQKEPRNDLTDVEGDKKLMRTPLVQKEPSNDLRNVKGVKQLMATPKVQKEPNNDLRNVQGLKQLMATPKVQKEPNNDLTNVQGLKQLMATPKVQKEPNNDLRIVKGVKQLMATPKVQKEPNNDLRNVQGLKQLMTFPKVQKEPKNDLTNVRGVKKLMSTPVEAPQPENDLSDVRGVKQLLRTPTIQKQPVNDLTNISGLKLLLKTPKTQGEASSELSLNDDVLSHPEDLRDKDGFSKLRSTPKKTEIELSCISNIKQVLDEYESNTKLGDYVNDSTCSPQTGKEHTPRDQFDPKGLLKTEFTPDRFNELSERQQRRTYLSRTLPKERFTLHSSRRASFGMLSESSPHVLQWLNEHQAGQKEKSVSTSAKHTITKLSTPKSSLTEMGDSGKYKPGVKDPLKIITPGSSFALMHNDNNVSQLSFKRNSVRLSKLLTTPHQIKTENEFSQVEVPTKRVSVKLSLSASSLAAIDNKNDVPDTILPVKRSRRLQRQVVEVEKKERAARSRVKLPLKKYESLIDKEIDTKRKRDLADFHESKEVNDSDAHKRITRNQRKKPKLNVMDVESNEISVTKRSTRKKAVIKVESGKVQSVSASVEDLPVKRNARKRSKIEETMPSVLIEESSQVMNDPDTFTTTKRSARRKVRFDAVKVDADKLLPKQSNAEMENTDAGGKPQRKTRGRRASEKVQKPRSSITVVEVIKRKGKSARKVYNEETDKENLLNTESNASVVTKTTLRNRGQKEEVLRVVNDGLMVLSREPPRKRGRPAHKVDVFADVLNESSVSENTTGSKNKRIYDASVKLDAATSTPKMTAPKNIKRSKRIQSAETINIMDFSLTDSVECKHVMSTRSLRSRK